MLRYGPPANFAGLVIIPDAKATKRLVTNLQSHFAYLAPRSKGYKSKGGGNSATAEGPELGAEYAALMEEEIFDFVLMEVPRIVN